MKARPWLLAVVVLCAPAGCAFERASANVAVHDFGAQRHADGPSPRSLARVEVAAASWLDTPAMQYRLAYASETRRLSYADSRWVAPPAELIERELARGIVAAGPGPAGGACTLSLRLDEFIQRFDAADASEGVVEARVALLAPRSETPLAQRELRASRRAASADAAGGVAALSGAVADLIAELRGWLVSVEREGGAAACRPR